MYAQQSDRICVNMHREKVERPHHQSFQIYRTFSRFAKYFSDIQNIFHIYWTWTFPDIQIIFQIYNASCPRKRGFNIFDVEQVLCAISWISKGKSWSHFLSSSQPRDYYSSNRFWLVFTGSESKHPSLTHSNSCRWDLNDVTLAVDVLNTIYWYWVMGEFLLDRKQIKKDETVKTEL